MKKRVIFKIEAPNRKENLHISRLCIRVIFLSYLLLIFFLCIYSTDVIYSQPTYRIEFKSYEYYGESSNEGNIMINNIPYELPSVVYLEAGTYIIFYVPEPEFEFGFWYMSGIELSKSEYDNPNAIIVSQQGVIQACYLKYPKLQINRPSELKDIVITRSPIELITEITFMGRPIVDAEVKFYVNGEYDASKLSDNYGYASITFEPSGESHYTWYVTAEKAGYTSSSCDEWEFTIVDLTLKPYDEYRITTHPVILKVSIKIDEMKINDASVYYYLDDVFYSESFTQITGTTTIVLDDVKPGPHAWFVTVWIPGYPNRITSDIQSFLYNPELTVFLDSPKNCELITEYTSTVELRAIVRTRDSAMHDVNCSFYVDGDLVGCNLTDEKGVVKLNYSPPIENKEYSWYVVGTKPSCINDTSDTWSFYYPVQPPYVEIGDYFPREIHVDVGSVQKIGFHLRWENGTNVEGAVVRISDDHKGITNDSGWVIFEVKDDQVCEKQYKITNVTCEGMGELRHNGKYPAIIWDRVSIELGPETQRVDVGSDAYLVERAQYEFDGSPLMGTIEYNEELYSDKVIKKIIGIKKINDEKYNLTEFSANDVTIIWDRVIIELNAVNYRIQKGKEAEVACYGVYEYDDKPFNGLIEFDNNLKQDSIGEVRYRIIGITDNLYNLSAFTYNFVSVIFDDIDIKQKIITYIPSQINVITEISFVYDGEPVSNAKVKVNGVGDYYNLGIYRATIFSYLPYSTIITEVEIDGFEKQISWISVWAIGNICILLSVAFFAFFLLSRIIVRRKI